MVSSYPPCPNSIHKPLLAIPIRITSDGKSSFVQKILTPPSPLLVPWNPVQQLKGIHFMVLLNCQH